MAKEGKGRRQALALGRVVDWTVTYRRDDETLQYKISARWKNYRAEPLECSRGADLCVLWLSVSLAYFLGNRTARAVSGLV